MGLTPDTRVLLSMMAQRVYFSLQRSLLDDKSYRDRVVTILTASTAEAHVEFEIRPLIHEFVLSSAHEKIIARICDRLPDLTWVELLDNLVRSDRCDLTYFGRFQVTEHLGKLGVAFRADDIFMSAAPPLLEGSSDEIEQAVISSCHPILVDVVRNFRPRDTLTSLERVQEVAIELLVASVPELAGALGDLLFRTASTGIFKDPFLVSPRALAYSAYYFYVWAISVSLESCEALEIERVGAFSRRGGRIEFKCSSDFLGLLAAGHLTNA